MKNKTFILLQIYFALSFVSAQDCDENQIIDLTHNNTDHGCFNNPQECEMFLSDESRFCMNSCQTDQYAIQMPGFIQCQPCYEKIFRLEGQRVQHCGQTCPDGYFYIEEDNSQFCRSANCTENQILDYTQKRCLNNPKECENLLSIDEKSCIFSCESGQYISQQSDYLQCKICDKNVYLLEGQQDQHCGYSCPDDYFYKEEDNSVFCRRCTENQIRDYAEGKCLNSPKECENVVSIDGKSCNNYCQDGQYEAQLPGYQQCKICDQDVFQFLYEKGQHCGYSCPNNYYNIIDTNKCIKNCYKKNYLDYQSWDECIEKMDCMFVSEDNPNQCLKDMNLCKGYFYQGVCLKSCPKGTYTSKKFDKIYGYCVKDCERNKYLDENGKIWCSDKCPNGLIIKNQRIREIQTCIKPQDCKGFVNYEQEYCRKSCDDQPFEEINGYKLCLKRQIFYIYDGETYREIDQCPDGYAINIDARENLCIPKSDCKITKYQTLYLSGDEQFCSGYCRLPEVATPDGKCINVCKNKPSCESRCPEGLYEEEYQSYGIFCSKNCSVGFISSDGKKCVYQCSKILEVNPGKYEKIQKCKKCPQGYFPILNDDNFTECRLQSQQQIQEQRLKYLKDLNDIDDQHQYDTYLLMLKEYINYYLSQHQDSFTAMLDVLSITSQLLDGNTYGGINVYSSIFESKEKNYKIVYSQVNGYNNKLKTSFNVEKLYQATYYDYYEIAKYITEADSEYSFIIMTILNPFCKINECQGSKLFIFKKGGFMQDRKQDLSQIFEVTFNIDPSITLKEKIICVTYDKDGNISPLRTILSQDQSTVTCSFQVGQSAAAYIVDENCQFVNQSLCSTIKKSLPNPNSTLKGENSLRGGGKR